MSTRNRKQDVIDRLRKSQQDEDNEIMGAAENIRNITTGMDVVQVELDKLIEAPLEWNFYSPLSEQKMSELIESIIDNGLLNPIILWEQDNEYMILAGHNRVRAYKMLYNQTENDKYRKIYAYIKKKNELVEEEARTIIIDTNFVQRQLSTREKTKSILFKYKELGRKKRNSEGKNTAAVIAEEYNLSERMVYNYYKLNNLIPEFMERIDSGTLSLKAGLKLAQLEYSFQEDIHNRYNEDLDNKKIMNLNINLTQEDILNQLSSEIDRPFIKVTFSIPAELENEFNKYVGKWISEKIV